MLLNSKVSSFASDFIMKRLSHPSIILLMLSMAFICMVLISIFFFDNVGENGLKELYKDVLKQLLTHMTYHIKQGSGTLLKFETTEFDALFGNMQIGYQIASAKVMNFKRGKELTSEIRHFVKNQRVDVPEKCIKIQFSTSRIYPSLLVGIVDQLNMDKLSSEKQAVLSIGLPTVIAENYLASIVTSMLTAVTGLNS